MNALNDSISEADEYPETADIETSSEAYARRFSGPAGEWMLTLQEDIVLGMLAGHEDSDILDVGGGHGQLAVPLAGKGFSVTVLGSSEECAGRIMKSGAADKIDFVRGNIIDMPFADNSFEVVTCIRLLPHCGRWRELIGELCRVAEKMVIVDYPTRKSLNFLSGAMFGIKKKIEGNTRPFALFTHSEIRREFAACGFEPAGRNPQFFLPMVLHRMMNSPRVSAAMESLCRKAGLTGFLGSPVLALFEKQGAPSQDQEDQLPA